MNKTHTKMLSIGELSARTGVATSALRFYEAKGLIRSERNDAGHRRFPREMIRRVAFIVFAQRIGLSLDEIGMELAKLPDDHIPSGEDWAQLTQAWGHRIDQQIRELVRLKSGLCSCIGCGCLSLESCALLNPDDWAGEKGAGPRYWMGDSPPQRRVSP